ncbi:hypothetical protein GGR52DRAFT_440789 [Hypoxylon sp. FL1284]|nr:hypothetical protein GGR52DRAFT_440789 [Hypoxylon sp. FL1284]
MGKGKVKQKTGGTGLENGFAPCVMMDLISFFFFPLSRPGSWQGGHKELGPNGDVPFVPFALFLETAVFLVRSGTGRRSKERKRKKKARTHFVVFFVTCSRIRILTPYLPTSPNLLIPRCNP